MFLRAKGVPDSRLQTLIGQIYDAALEPAQWQAFLEHLAAAHNGAAIMYQQDPLRTAARVFAGVNVDVAMREPYENYYSRIRPWREQLARVPVGDIVVPISRWIEEASYRKTEYYNDYLARMDLYHHMFSVLAREDGVNTAVVLVRSRRGGDFAVKERDFSAKLVPHLQRALQMNRHLHAAALQKQALLRGLEGLGVGVILARGDGGMLFANGVAEGILARGDGLAARQGRLFAATPALSQELHRLIRAAADTGAGQGRESGGTMRLPHRAGDETAALICPFPVAAAETVGPTMPAALIFLGGPAPRTPVRQGDLQAIYGLTAAEARLVGALLAGLPLRDYAKANNIGIETTRTQLRHVFDKTGQRRQADLVRHILANPIVQLASHASLRSS